MLITSTNITEITEAISAHVNEDAALITIGEHTEIDIKELINQLNTSGVNFMGGIFQRSFMEILFSTRASSSIPLIIWSPYF